MFRNTVRTNHFAAPARETLAVKLDSRNIGELPEPRPRHEIFVYSPVVAGVHMRFGSVARGEVGCTSPPSGRRGRGPRDSGGASRYAWSGRSGHLPLI